MTQQPTNREPRYKLEQDGMGTYISEDEIPQMAPAGPMKATDQGELERQIAWLQLYTVMHAEGNVGQGTLDEQMNRVLALIAREREAANLNGYKNGISVGAVIAKQAIEDGREPLTAADQFITDLDTPNQQETKHE